MPFSTTGSVVSTDLDNMVRGLYRDNADHTVTGTASETDMASVSIAANTIGSTGAIHIIAAGTITGTNGTKTFRLKFGSSTITPGITDAAGTINDWYFDAWCFNVGTGAQRWLLCRRTDNAVTCTFDYTSSAEDTTQNRTLKITAQLGNGADSVTETMFDVFVVQIT